MRQTLEFKGCRLRMTKTWNLQCKFIDITHEVDVGVKIDTQVIPKGEISSILGQYLKEIRRLTMMLHIVLEQCI